MQGDSSGSTDQTVYCEHLVNSTKKTAPVA